MTGNGLELMIEFTVILVSPILYHVYLLKYKKLPRVEVMKDVKIFAFLYLLIAITSGFVLFR